MSEPPKEQASAKGAPVAKLDSTSAAAALALAVTSAQKTSESPAKKLPDASSADLRETEDLSPAGWRNHLGRAAGIVIVVGFCVAGGSLALSKSEHLSGSAPEWAASVRQNQEELGRLSDEMRALKSTVESMREALAAARVEAAGQQRSFMERAERVEQAAQDMPSRIALLAEASGRIEHANTDIATKLAVISGRLDGMERQASGGKSASVAADGPAQTGSVPDGRLAVKHVVGWVLRDVFDGIALVESRSGRLHEVVPGQNLPGLGRVQAIERRSRKWVVVTSKGIIGAPERWQ